MDSVNDRLQDAATDDNYEGLAIGTVIENEDPEGLGRFKVKVPEALDPDQGPVPWVLPMRYSPFGQGVDYGVYGSPKIESGVRVSFQNGDPQCPVYESAEYLKAFANPKFASPDTWGFKDWGGSELWVNMRTGAWEFTHQSGSYAKYDGDGNLVVHTVKDQTQTIGSNLTITTVGDTVIKSGGQITLDAPAVATTGNLSVATGWTGSFGTATGQTVTVQNGIIINVA
jgi:hypothetical protein